MIQSRLTVTIGLLLILGCDRPPAAQMQSDTADRSTEASMHPTEGVWTTKSATLGGVTLPSEQMGQMTLTIRGNTYQVEAAGTVDRGNCSIDENANPKRMTIQGTDGPNAGKTYFAIYEFADEDTLRICYDLSGEHSPTAFESPQASQLFLVEYERTPADSLPGPKSTATPSRS